jgi:hypothetical protein
VETEELKILQQILQNQKHLVDLLENYEPSNGYKIVLFLVPIFGIVFGSILLSVISYFWYKQRLELIKSGLYKPSGFDFRIYSFFVGLVLSFTGIALSVVFIIVLGNSLAMLGGVIPLAIGLSLLTYYKLQK